MGQGTTTNLTNNSCRNYEGNIEPEPLEHQIKLTIDAEEQEDSSFTKVERVGGGELSCYRKDSQTIIVLAEIKVNSGTSQDLNVIVSNNDPEKNEETGTLISVNNPVLESTYNKKISCKKRIEIFLIFFYYHKNLNLKFDFIKIKK